MKKDIYVENEKIFVTLPYTESTPKKFRSAGGEWDGSKWIFEYDEDVLCRIKDIIKKDYKYDVDAERKTAYITFNEETYKGKAPYTLGGFGLSIARGRDSGATTGEGVLLINGNIGSGGSMKNWSSEIEKGTKFKIKNFPVGAEAIFEEDAEFINIEYIDDENKEEKINELEKFSAEELLAELEKRNKKDLS